MDNYPLNHSTKSVKQCVNLTRIKSKKWSLPQSNFRTTTISPRTASLPSSAQRSIFCKHGLSPQFINLKNQLRPFPPLPWFSPRQNLFFKEKPLLPVFKPATPSSSISPPKPQKSLQGKSSSPPPSFPN